MAIESVDPKAFLEMMREHERELDTDVLVGVEIVESVKDRDVRRLKDAADIHNLMRNSGLNRKGRRAFSAMVRGGKYKINECLTRARSAALR